MIVAMLTSIGSESLSKEAACRITLAYFIWLNTQEQMALIINLIKRISPQVELVETEDYERKQDRCSKSETENAFQNKALNSPCNLLLTTYIMGTFA